MAIDRVKASAILDGSVTSADLDTNIAIAGNLTVDTDTLHVDSANNRVGIGTTSPATALDVVGTIAADGLTVTQTGSTTATIGATGTSGDNDGTLIINNGGTGDGMLRFDYETNTDRARIGVTASTQDLIFYTAGSEKARILSAGGITFNGDTAATNALDDYEEGTWTPVTNGLPSYNYQLGHYTKVGNVVHFSIYMSLSVAGGASALDITLPFASHNVSNRHHAYQGWTNAWSSSANSVQWILTNGVNYIRAYNIVASGNVTGLLVNAVGTGNLIVTGSYRTA